MVTQHPPGGTDSSPTEPTVYSLVEDHLYCLTDSDSLNKLSDVGALVDDDGSTCSEHNGKCFPIKIDKMHTFQHNEYNIDEDGRISPEQNGKGFLMISNKKRTFANCGSH